MFYFPVFHRFRVLNRILRKFLGLFPSILWRITFKYLGHPALPTTIWISSSPYSTLSAGWRSGMRLWDKQLSISRTVYRNGTPQILMRDPTARWKHGPSPSSCLQTRSPPISDQSSQIFCDRCTGSLCPIWPRRFRLGILSGICLLSLLSMITVAFYNSSTRPWSS